MKVVVDRAKCQGYGNCVMAAEDVFDLDDGGLAVVRIESPDPSRRAAVDEAVRLCPVAAISVED